MKKIVFTICIKYRIFPGNSIIHSSFVKTKEGWGVYHARSPAAALKRYSIDQACVVSVQVWSIIRRLQFIRKYICDTIKWQNMFLFQQNFNILTITLFYTYRIGDMNMYDFKFMFILRANLSSYYGVTAIRVRPHP